MAISLGILTQHFQVQTHIDVGLTVSSSAAVAASRIIRGTGIHVVTRGHLGPAGLRGHMAPKVKHG